MKTLKVVHSYNSTLSLTSALDGVCRQSHELADLPARRDSSSKNAGA